MNSRDTILNKIRANRPQESVEMPTNITFDVPFADSLTRFSEVLTSIGGDVFVMNNISDFNWQMKYPHASYIISFVPEITQGNIDINTIQDPHDLASLDLAILRGQLGVAENGAIWLDESNWGGHRVLPFITQHLIIVLEKSKIVNTLHEAYRRINIAEKGFSLFLAGPSKTADIEQSLVIGAHGARSLTVILID